MEIYTALILAPVLHFLWSTYLGQWCLAALVITLVCLVIPVAGMSLLGESE